MRREEKARDPDDEGNRQAYGDGLHAGDGCALGIFFANAACDHGGGGQAEAEADGENEAEQRFGEADGGDCVCAEAADPEDIDYGEERFQHHFEDHGNGQQQNGAIQAAPGEVLVRAANGFADRLPDRDGPWFES